MQHTKMGAYIRQLVTKGRMKLELERDLFTSKSTIGQLWVDGIEFCFTLEDPVREKEGVPVKGWKIQGDTAIPRGIYNVEITYSNRFQRDLPILENVEGFTGIRIHPGNTSVDTEGCILVGRTRGENFVGESRAAFNELFSMIEKALGAGDTVVIEVS